MTGKMIRTCAVGVAVVLLTAWIHTDIQAAITYRTVYLDGEQVPGLEPGVLLGPINRPLLSGAGQLAFNGRFTGPGVDFTNDSIIWSEGSGSLAIVARVGDPVPGMGSVSFARFGTSVITPPVIINNAGQTAFFSTLKGLGVNAANDGSIWTEGSGSLALVAREGDPAPGAVLAVFDTLDNYRLVLNAAGQTAFFGTLTNRFGVSGFVDTTNDSGIWSEGSGSLALVAREGGAAPGTGPGVVFNSFVAQGILNDGFSFTIPVGLNDGGQSVFWATLSGSGVDTTNDSGIWTKASGSPTLVARAGEVAPGTEPGVTFSNMGVFNNHFQVACLKTMYQPQ